MAKKGKNAFDWRDRVAPKSIKLSQGRPLRYEELETNNPDLLKFILTVMVRITNLWYVQPCPTGFKVYDLETGKLVPLVELKNVHTLYRHTGKTK